jgi:hypothetical protein
MSSRRRWCRLAFRVAGPRSGDWHDAIIGEAKGCAMGPIGPDRRAPSTTSRPCPDSTAQTAIVHVAVAPIGSLAQSVAAPASLFLEDMFQELWWAFGGMVA